MPSEMAPDFTKLSLRNVEYNLVEHCNLSCSGCDHASPFMPKTFAALADFVQDFEALKEIASLNSLYFVGGEPLLHPDLLSFLEESRRLAIASRIVVWTNGVLLHQAPDRFWQSIDELVVTFYPNVHVRMRADDLMAKCRAHGVSLLLNYIGRGPDRRGSELRYVGEFQKTLLNREICDAPLVEKIFQRCENKGCHTVYDGHFFKCSVAPFVPERLRLGGRRFEHSISDSVQLRGNTNLYRDLKAYLKSCAPLAACRFCLGTSGPPIEHRQLNRKQRVFEMSEDDSEKIEWV